MAENVGTVTIAVKTEVMKETPTLKQIGLTLLDTLHESVDSKKSMTGLIGAIASILVLLAGKQGWSWLDQQTAQMIAGVIVVKGLAVIAAHAHVDAKREGAGNEGPADPVAALAGVVGGSPTGTPVASAPAAPEKAA